MICERVMQRPVRTVCEADSVEWAARLMHEAHVGFLPVRGADGKVIGVLTDRDIVVRAIAIGLPSSTRVGDVMTREVVACRPRDDLFVAQTLMRTRHTSRVLCVDEQGMPAGVISFSDIARNEDGLRLAKTVRQLVGVPSETFAAAE
jgi:CBS domain-containing protein